MTTSKPWMPLYVADYRADTAHLSASEHGAYLMLIMHYWQTGGLPKEDGPLSRIACMTASEWRKARGVIASFFDEQWRHKRIDQELAHAAEISSKRSASAKQRHSNSSANANTLHTSHITEEKKEDAALRADAPPKSRRKSKSQLPDDWVPSSDSTLTPFGESELAKMRDWAKSNAIVKADWDATWRNWMRRASEQPQGKPHGTHAPNGLSAALKHLRRSAEEEAIREIEGSTSPRLLSHG